MTYRNESPVAATQNSQLSCAFAADTCRLGTRLRSTLLAALAVLALGAVSMAGELPEAPSSIIRTNAAVMVEAVAPVPVPRIVAANREVKPIDKTFVSLALISTGSTFADSYTTLFARENWLAGKKGVCNVEVQSAYLYGSHPTVARAYAVASAKSIGSVVAAYYLRKHHNRFWSLPLIANSVTSLQGVAQNMAACN
jgi:hypothetical protein